MEYDVRDTIDKLAAMGYIRPGRITGSWYQICCPIHNNGQERKPSCGVLLHDEMRNGSLYKQGTFHCFSCHYAKSMPEAITDIFANNGVNMSGEEWLEKNVEGYKPASSNSSALIPSEVAAAVSECITPTSMRAILNFAKKPSYVSEEELASYRYTVPYMYQRRLTDEVIAKYDVGYDANHIPPGRKTKLPCVTFPVRDVSGNTLFFCRRSIEGKYFNYPQGVQKPVYGLYELCKNPGVVIICESIFNALTCVVYGYNAVALMGTGNSYQIEQLRRMNVRQFVICLDNDDAGRRGAAKLKKALVDIALISICTVPEGKDVNDLTKEEFDAVFTSRE